jgi:hypothetical protein
MNGKTLLTRLTRRIARAVRRVFELTLTASLAVTLAACAAQPRGEMSIVEIVSDAPRSASLACVAQSEALVCETSGRRSRLDRRCTCVDRHEFAAPRPF